MTKLSHSGSYFVGETNRESKTWMDQLVQEKDHSLCSKNQISDPSISVNRFILSSYLHTMLKSSKQRSSAYPVFRIWQGRVDINVNFFWEKNNSKTIKPKSASRRKWFLQCASFCNFFLGMQWLIQVITVKTNCESMENSTRLEYLSPYMFENGPASIAN